MAWYDPLPATGAMRTVSGASRKKRDINSSHSLIEKKHPYRYGRIIAVRKIKGTTSTPFIRVRYEDTGEESGWIILQDHPLFIAQCYAARLEDLVGMYRVKIEYPNYTSKGGFATIIAERKANTEEYDPELESQGLRII